ncbi:MAG: polysaccharide deacetylase family protein [Candidatus Sulfotelmatobacter sp.]
MATTTQSRGPRGIVFFLLRMSALPFLIREFFQRRWVTIIVYHRIDPETADRHFSALRRRYNIIRLVDYVAYRTDARKSLPPKPLIVTFDDGHKSNYALKPIFEKHGIRPTSFLCSGLVGTRRHYWFDTRMNEGERQSLKLVSDQDRLETLARLGFSETAELATRQAMSAGEIEEMKPRIDFQSHTVYHPLLPQCSASRSAVEISDSKTELTNKFGLSIYALAYPNGDYTSREVAAAAASGYTCALTLDHGFNSRTTPPFQLKRICINDDASVDELLVKASGIWGFLKNLARRRAELPKGIAADYPSPDLRSAS